MASTVTIISSMATRLILQELAASFSNGGHTVRIESVGGVEAAQRLRAGEVFDVAVLAADALQGLAGEGHVLPHSVRAFARSPTAVAVPSGGLGGVAHPGSCDEAAIRALVAGGKTIALSTGPSGKSMTQLLQSWGGVGSGKFRIVNAPPGVPVARLLARGDADVGFQQLSELLGEPGIDIVGTVDESLLPMTVFSCGISLSAADAAAAEDLIKALISPEAVAAKRRGGMEQAD
jgi:molybdate transport system substrate-binding protein